MFKNYRMFGEPSKALEESLIVRVDLFGGAKLGEIKLLEDISYKVKEGYGHCSEGYERVYLDLIH